MQWSELRIGRHTGPLTPQRSRTQVALYTDLSMASVTTQAPGREASPVLPLLALCVIIGILFVLQLRHFSPFITDDAYISLRYSQRLLEGHGLTWNDTRPVEGYTNLLWVLICAAMGAIHIPLPLAAHILGVTTTLLILVAVVAYIFEYFPAGIRFFSALVTCSALVLSSTFSMWALGGLEQPLLACLLAWAAYRMLPWLQEERPQTGPAISIGLLLGFAVITRADAALFTAAFFAAAVIADKISTRSFLSRSRILPIPIVFFLGQLVFRRIYYREWLPNTAFVKIAFTMHRIRSGASYVYHAIRMNFVLVLLILLASYALWRTGRALYRKPVIFLWTVAFIWTVYVVSIGGDIFPASRHFEPMVALLGFLLPGLGLLIEDSQRRKRRNVAAGVLAATLLVVTSDAMTDQEHWESQGQSLGLFIHQAFNAQQPLLSSDAAGVVPFFSHFPALDPLGLNDYHIAHVAISKDRGHGWVGHELGDGAYILDQKPDLLLFSSFTGESGLFPADQQIVDDPRFKNYYQAVLFDTPDPDHIRAFLYLRRRDGKIGMRTTAEGLVVPGYLASINKLNSVHLVDGHAALVIPPYGSATFERLPLDAGSWKIEAEPPSAVSTGPLKGAESVPGCNLCLRTLAATDVNITINNPSGEPITLSSFLLRRQAPQQRP